MDANAYKLRLQTSYERDLRDAAAINAMLGMVTKWRDEFALKDFRLEHPDARWSPADLLEQLDTALLDLQGEAARVRGPVVVE